jgi:excisionase family DNA binding protein
MDVFTIADAASALHVHKDTVRKMIRTGELRAYRVSDRTIRIKAEDLAAALQVVEPSHGPEAA